MWSSSPLSLSTPPGGRGRGRSQVKARGGGSRSGGSGGGGDGCQTCRAARRSGHGASSLAAAGGQPRGECASERGAGNRVAAARSRQLVFQSCSVFRFQVTNQVSEAPCRPSPRSAFRPSAPPRSPGGADFVAGRSLLRVRLVCCLPSPAGLLEMLPAGRSPSSGPLPPSSRFLGVQGFRDYTPYACPSDSLRLLLPARSDPLIFSALHLLGD